MLCNLIIPQVLNLDPGNKAGKCEKYMNADVNFRTPKDNSDARSVRLMTFEKCATFSNNARLRRRPPPDEDRPIPQTPPQFPDPDRWDDRRDKILPSVGPHGPGGGEPCAPDEPDTHDSGRGEP